MKVSLVVAASPDGVIGRDGQLPWHLPGDLRRFRAITLGHPIIMGRRTHKSIGRPLPGRLNVVVTRDPECRAEGCAVAHSPEDALRISAESGAIEAMVIGGEQIYRDFLPTCDAIHLTVVEGRFEGDARFPIEQLSGPAWIVEHRRTTPPTPATTYPHRYECSCRRRGPIADRFGDPSGPRPMPDRHNERRPTEPWPGGATSSASSACHSARRRADLQRWTRRMVRRHRELSRPERGGEPMSTSVDPSAARTHDSPSLHDLYERDETAWLDAMARLAAERRHEEFDFEHLSEFLADMASRDRREVFNRLECS